MSGAAISPALRFANWQRAAGRCEYCFLHEEDALIPHQPDHIIASQHGGSPASENLALACYDCNLFKGPNIASVDPENGQPSFLFNPRRDRWAEHFRIAGGHIKGLTPAGRATVFLLKLNTPDRVRLRRQLQRLHRYPH